MSLSFGAYITASLFLPDGVDTSEPLPLVIFLHGYSYQLGYTGIYGETPVRGLTPQAQL